jgi:hypothetical protein
MPKWTWKVRTLRYSSMQNIIQDNKLIICTKTAWSDNLKLMRSVRALLTTSIQLAIKNAYVAYNNCFNSPRFGLSLPHLQRDRTLKYWLNIWIHGVIYHLENWRSCCYMQPLFTLMVIWLNIDNAKNLLTGINYHYDNMTDCTNVVKTYRSWDNNLSLTTDIQFYRRQKKTWPILNRQTLMHVMFYENVCISNFLWTWYIDRTCVCKPTV